MESPEAMAWAVEEPSGRGEALEGGEGVSCALVVVQAEVASSVAQPLAERCGVHHLQSQLWLWLLAGPRENPWGEAPLFVLDSLPHR